MVARNTRVAPETQVRSPARSFLNSLDNFYAPQRDTRKEAAFQEGLAGFSGILQEQADRNKRTQREDEYQQGVQDAFREQAGEELKGVKTGSIFRQHSSFYMAGLNETRGKAKAAQFKAHIARAYQDWEGKHTDDNGEAFRAWMNNEIGTFMGSLGEDQHMVAGALPVINEVANNYAAQHTAFTNQRLEQESFEAYDEIVSGIFSDMSQGAFSVTDPETGITSIDFDAVADVLKGEADDMYSTDGAAANDRVVQAAIRYANIHNDPDAILAMAKAHDTGKIKLSQMNRERLANAMDAVEADIERHAAKQNAQDAKAAKAAREAALNNWATVLQDDPYADLPSFSEVGDYKTYQEMVRLQDSFTKADAVENPAITNRQRMQFEMDLQRAATSQDKMNVLTDFVSANPSAMSGADVSRYTKDILSMEQAGSLMQDPTVSSFRDNFVTSLGQLVSGDEFDFNRIPAMATRAEWHYDRFLSTQAGDIDLSNARAISDLTLEAREYALQRIDEEFPGMLTEKAEAQPNLANAIGAAQVGAEGDRMRAEAEAQEALAAYQQFAGQGGEEPTTVEPDADPLTPDPEPEMLDEDVETEDPEVIQSKPDSFYQEVLNRFIDGEDTRSEVSPSVLVETAKRILGADENAQNSMIQEFLADGGVNLDPAKTAWCAGFINAVLEKNGITGTGSNLARSFLNWGEDVTDSPQEGDIVVLTRGRRNSWKGHVGIFQGFDENGNILVLGGNQGNRVSIKPYDAGKLLGFRRAPGTSGGSTAETLRALQ